MRSSTHVKYWLAGERGKESLSCKRGIRGRGPDWRRAESSSSSARHSRAGAASEAEIRRAWALERCDGRVGQQSGKGKGLAKQDGSGWSGRGQQRRVHE